MTGMVGPEAVESDTEMGVLPHAMQTELPSTSNESKEGFTMAVSQRTIRTVRGSKKGHGKNM